MTKFTISGRLTADPQLRFIPSGDAVATFTVAQNDRKYDKATNSWVDGETLFIKVDAWRQLGEGAAERLAKGDLVVVTGTLKPESWEKDGQKRTSIKLVADEIGVSVRARKTAAAQPVQEPVW